MRELLLLFIENIRYARAEWKARQKADYLLTWVEDARLSPEAKRYV